MASSQLNFKSQHDTEVKTGRLSLSPVANEDLAVIHAMRLNPMVMQYMPGVETEQDALKSYSVKRMELMMKEHMFSFAVRLKQGANAGENPVIGFIGITSPPQIFYIFDEKFWGNGFATEALKAFLESYWATYPNGLQGVDDELRHHLEAHVHDGNTASERILAKCGFSYVRDGTTESHGKEIIERIFRLDRPGMGA